MICGTAVIAGPLRIGENVIIGDGADIASAADFETHRLSWGETITLNRCEDGAVGLGRTPTDHGPLAGRRTTLLDAVIRNSHFGSASRCPDHRDHDVIHHRPMCAR